MTIKKESFENQVTGSISRRGFIVRGTLGAFGIALFPFNSLQASIQGKRRKITFDDIDLSLDSILKVIERLKNAYDLYQDIKTVIQVVTDPCDIVPEICRQSTKYEFPVNPALYQLGSIYAFAARPTQYSDAFALFYNNQNRETILIPWLVAYGIEKAVQDFEGSRNKSLIFDWIIPISPYQFSILRNTGDCYIYRSRNGYVRIMYEDGAYSGDRVNVKLIKSTLPRKERNVDDLSFPVPKQLPSRCSSFEEYEPVWEKSFYF
jgi:hypothetical protein